MKRCKASASSQKQYKISTSQSMHLLPNYTSEGYEDSVTQGKQ